MIGLICPIRTAWGTPEIRTPREPPLSGVVGGRLREPWGPHPEAFVVRWWCHLITMTTAGMPGSGQCPCLSHPIDWPPCMDCQIINLLKMQIKLFLYLQFPWKVLKEYIEQFSRSLDVILTTAYKTYMFPSPWYWVGQYLKQVQCISIHFLTLDQSSTFQAQPIFPFWPLTC